jgi:murein DD-endopeptidase MepM/ murein hydrolase activator NlpD
MHVALRLGSRALHRTALAAAVGSLVVTVAAVQHGVWPLDPRPEVVQRFDPPAHRWEAGHRGVDLAGHLGQPVHAALGGQVTFAGRLAGRGIVVVSHGATRTTYEPVAASVSAGDRVRAGDVIGSLQLFSSHCFPAVCLHWGLIEGREHYLDPLALVGAGPVRLFPPARARLMTTHHAAN